MPDRISEIRKRLLKATPGHWDSDADGKQKMIDKQLICRGWRATLTKIKS